MLAAVGLPYRLDFPIGPFATVSILDVALLGSATYVGLKFVLLRPLLLGPGVVSTSVFFPIFVAFISVSWAANTSLSAAAAIKYAYTGLCYLIALQFGGSWSRSDLVRALLVVFAFWLMGSIAMYLGVPGFTYFLAAEGGLSQSEAFDLVASIYTRLGHPYIGQSNDYGPRLVLLGFIFLGYARHTRDRAVGIASALAFIASIFTFSRGLIAGLLIALASYALLARVSIARIVLAGFVTSIAIGLGWMLLQSASIDLEDRRIDIGDIVESRLSEDNLEARLRRYGEAITAITHRPLLGHGVGFRDRALSRLDAAHNAYLEQWTYFGVILGTITSLCYLTVIFYFWRLRKTSPQQAPFTDAIACGWLFLALTSATQTFFEASTPRAVIYFVLGLCVCMVSKEAQATKDEYLGSSVARSTNGS